MKIFLIHFIILFAVVMPVIASANLEISEIMYDPKGSNANHQWVEVYNSGSSPVSVDASKWRFNDGSSHYMNNKVSFSVSANSFFILTGDLATFDIDHPGFSGIVIDTSMSLDKDGGTVSILNDGQVIDSVTYSATLGGAEDGNSLHKSGSIWVASTPTPGSLYQSSTTIDNQENIPNQSSDTENNTSVGASPKVNTKISKISTEIISKSVVTSGVDFKLSQKTIGLDKELIKNGRLVWNFGDGISRDTLDFNTPFLYRYDYPGEYLITLSYYKDYFSDEPEFTDRLNIKVVSPGVVISSIGSPTDPYIEIENKSSYEASVSGWKIQGTKNNFYFAVGTTIMPGKKIKLPSRITGFNFEDLSSVSMYSPAGELFATYPPTANTNFENKNTNTKIQTIKSTNTNTTKTASDKYKKVINLDDLSAQAGNTRVPISWPVIIIVIGFAMFGASLYLYYLAYKGSMFQRKDNLDSKIRPEDMDILE
ncbi:MAG: lamin tail domain-containing protein [Candidatus Pacebacteria bacterium]|nr:lamin tail domain-containing protein [Candidatus Paceibacterota bacterium]MBP9715825.1 lamin tail domain-containing protein [Candidatus Paceibacterota bacterium]